MTLALFDHKRKRITTASVNGDGDVITGAYYSETEQRQVHDSPYDLVFTIDTKIAFPRTKGLPAVLPILYRMRDPDFEHFAYRVTADSTVTILGSGETYDYSESRLATHQPLFGSRAPFNPRKAEDAMAWAGVFSLDGLSRAEMRRAIEIADKRWGDDWSDYMIIPWSENTPKSKMLRLEWVEPFGQNASFRCPSLDNNCHRGFFGTATLPLVLYEKSPSMNLFGDFNPQLIVTYCSRCRTIGVENQCD
ncbi:hypothetical protein [Blastopirellula marina]|uniref:Uncharacterized protein n=1 Tax=Blastopirellula marina DSM 3645 TaxID=314230 RepID=A3ZN03_9BACT|nr:hypothetical protein [Blastopirellula marina]EAQ82332.1 hypothetical protein DSM3645_01420 [Blastopirellula marina DSM 3645]